MAIEMLSVINLWAVTQDLTNKVCENNLSDFCPP